MISDDGTWGLFLCDDGINRIQRVDDRAAFMEPPPEEWVPPAFESDQAAFDHVVGIAIAGDAFAQRALGLVGFNRPN